MAVLEKNNLNVRLKDFEIDAIKECFRQYFRLEDHIWLFGSRVDLAKRGGDIDLYVETSMHQDQVLKVKLSFIDTLCEKIGDQKIDLVVKSSQDSNPLAIYKVARDEGVKIL